MPKPPPIVDVFFTRGADFNQPIALRDESQEPIDLSGATVELTLKLSGKDCLVFSQSPAAGQGTITVAGGRITLYAHRTLAAATLASAPSGVLFVTWTDGLKQGLLEIRIKVWG